MSIFFRALNRGEVHLPGTLCGHAHGSGRLQEQRVAGLATGDGVSLIAMEN